MHTLSCLQLRICKNIVKITYPESKLFLLKTRKHISNSVTPAKEIGLMNTKRVVIVLTLVFLIVSVVFIALYTNQASNGSDDIDPPVVVIISPVEDDEVSGTVSVNFTATDQSPIVNHEILIDGVFRTGTQAYSWDTTAEINGLHNAVTLKDVRYTFHKLIAINFCPI